MFETDISVSVYFSRVEMFNLCKENIIPFNSFSKNGYFFGTYE